MKLNIWMHDSYQFDQNEYCRGQAHTDLDGYIDNLQLQETTIPYLGSSGSQNTLKGLFAGTISIRRHQGMIGKGSMIKVHSRYDDTPAGSYATFLGLQLDNLYWDNRTTNDDDVCMEVGTKAMVMFVHGHIINSLSNSTNGDYHGIGVLLVGSNGRKLNERGAIELGTEVAYGGGTSSISGCKFAIDQRNGVTRFKGSNTSKPYDLSDNDIGINVHPGTYVSKWCTNISNLNSKNVVITLAEADKWHSGDIVFASGFTNEGKPGSNAPLTTGDYDRIDFFDELTKKRYKRDFDSSVQPGKSITDDTSVYPCIRLSGGVIYNMTKGGKRWYFQLQEAVNDANPDDELVYFGTVDEEQEVVIGKNLTIRAASENNAADVAVTEDKFDIIPAGYITFKDNNGTNFIKIVDGANVTIGGANSGKLTFNCEESGRGIEVVNGTLNLGLNTVVTNGTANLGGGIYAVENTATVTLASTGNMVYNNNATTAGADIYVSADVGLTIGTVADGLLLEPCECSFIDGWYVDEQDNRWVGHSETGDYHSVAVTDTSTPAVYALKAAHREPSVLVHWVNWDGSYILDEYIKIGTKEPEYTGVTPYRDPTSTKSYNFTGWNYGDFTWGTDELNEPHGPYTFTAVYQEVDRKALVIFYDYNGDILQQSNYGLNETPAYTGTKTPTRTTTITDKEYEFNGTWTPAITTVNDVTRTYEYYPNFTEYTLYTITYRDAEDQIWEKFTKVRSGDITPMPDPDPTREHYTFAGWKNWSATVTGDATYDPLWTPDKFVVEYVDTFGNTYHRDSYDYDSAMPTAPSVTHPASVTTGDAADYDFASWTCSVDPVPSRVPAENVTFTAQWDTFFHVHVGDIDNRIAVAQAEDGKFDVTLPIADVLAYPSNTIYAGLWTDSTKSAFKNDVCGKEMPVAVSTHVYVREIADCYAKSFVLSVGTKGTYASMLMAAIDVSAAGQAADVPYKKVGFVFTDDKNTTLVEDFEGSELYSKVNVTINGVADSYDSENCECPAGMMLFCRTLDSAWLLDQKDTPLTLHSYFVTPDGVRVYAASYKEITFKVTAKPARTTKTCAYTTEKEIDNASAPYGEEMLPMLQLETFSLGEPAVDDVVVTLHVDGLESTITGKAGDDFRALAGCPVLEGFFFAGWYEDQEFTIPADLSQVDVDTDVYACFVKADGLLEVNSSSTSARGRLVRVRLVSACHAEAVASCGFLVERDGNVSVVPEECFRSVDGATAESLFGIDDAMLFYCDLPVSALTGTDELKVTPFWMTLDGTRVCGKATTVELKK